MFPMAQAAELERHKELVALSRVDNTVEYVNPNISSPFSLQEGVKSDLGLFLSPKVQDNEPTFNVEKQKRHGRAGLVGRVILQDKEGRRYRDIDGKGFGYLSEKHIFTFSGTPGILNFEAAKKELDVSEQMLKIGLRASRVLSIIKLKEIFNPDGNRIAIEEAKKKKFIKQTDEPVVEIRLMGTNARIQDLVVDYKDYEADKERHDLFLSDAKTMVAQELGKKDENFDLKDYALWFAENLGQQVAVMHRNGWIHIGLTDQNITLDGRIVDFATSNNYSKNKPNSSELLKAVVYSEDITRATRSLKKFYRYVVPLDDNRFNLNELVDKFKAGYFGSLGLAETELLAVTERLQSEIEVGLSDDF